MQVRLPAGDDTTSLLYIVAYIRDTFDGVTEYNVSSVTVVPDLEEINNLVNSLQESSSTITSNAIVQLLSGGNQNTIGQIISSISQQFNKMNSQTIATAAASEKINHSFSFSTMISILDGISVSTIAISALGSRTLQSVNYLFFLPNERVTNLT
jgi:hypothetical protein